MKTRTARGQEEPPAQAEAPAQAKGIVEVKPETFYLKDENGNLIPSPNMTFEEFEALYQLREGLAGRETPPEYHLEMFSLRGSVAEDRVFLEVDSRIELRTDHWVRIPLRLPGVFLTAAAKIEGAEEAFVERREDGYACWVRGKKGVQVHVALTGFAVLGANGPEATWSFSSPRATTSSLTLKITAANIEARISGAGSLRQEAVSAGETRLTVVGLGGASQLAWRIPTIGDKSPQAVLEASGLILIHAQDDQRLHGRAELTVNAFGGPLETFDVRLPPGMVLVSGNGGNYSVEVVDTMAPGNNKGRKEDAGVQTVRVRLEQPSDESISVVLETESTRSSEKNQDFEVGGFSVVGAVREWGYLALSAADDWTVNWREKEHIRRSDELPESLRGENVVASFEYVRQPCSLLVRVEQKKSRVAVEPLYLIYVHHDELILEARLLYSIRGARANFVDIELSDWELVSVGPPGLVNQDAVNYEQTSPLLVPLAQAKTGEFEVVIRAKRTLEAGAASFVASLPSVTANTPQTSRLVILPDDDIVLSPLPETLQTLAPEASFPMLSEESRRRPLYYRVRRGVSSPEFRCSFSTRDAAITVESANTVRIGPVRTSLQQSLNYKIAYQWIDRLEIDAPLAMLEANDLKITADGEAAPFDRVDNQTTPAAKDRAAIQIRLPSRRKGDLALQLRWSRRTPPLDEGRRMSLQIPLAVPTDANVSQTNPASAEIVVDARLKVENKSNEWRTLPPLGESLQQQSMVLSHDGFARIISLEAMPVSPQEQQKTTVVDKVWVRSAWLRHSRTDQAIMQARTTADALRVRLPRGARLQAVQVAFDGERAKESDISLSTNEHGVNVLVVAAPADAARDRDTAEHRVLLSISYERPLAERKLRRERFEMPLVLGAGAVERMYWQIALPRGEQLFLWPADLTPEFAWVWSGYLFERRPTLTDADLKRWIGLEAQDSPTPHANVYLFGAFSNVAPGTLVVLHLRDLLIACSSVVLVLGLALIYFPVLSGARFLAAAVFVLAVSVVGLSAWAPDAAMLLAQSSVVGALGVGVARMLSKWSENRVRRVGRPVLSQTSAADSTRTRVLAAAPYTNKSTINSPASAPEA